MNTENAMKTLHAARRAIGLSAQGIGCSPTVIIKTLKQLERDVGPETAPRTIEVLKGMLSNKGLVSEKLAMTSMDEIKSLREEFRPRPMLLTEHQVEAEQQDVGEDDSPRPH